jgi:hypothetical protein
MVVFLLREMRIAQWFMEELGREERGERDVLEQTRER